MEFILGKYMNDRCPKSVGDAKQTLEIRVEPGGAVRDNGNGIYFSSCTYLVYVGSRQAGLF